MRLALAKAAAGLVALLTLPDGVPPSANAQGGFDARYTLSMAGLPIGKFTWRAQIGTTDYATSAAGRTSGILSLLISGEGSVAVRGSVKDGRPQSTSYMSAVTRDDEKSSVKMLIDFGRVRELKVEEPPPESDRVPILEAHKQDVSDPLTALLIPQAGADPLAPSGCERVLSIFDGRRRYDLGLSFRRIDQATPEKGYAGPALVCAIKFTPLAGHRTSSPLVKVLVESRDFEVWFVPVAGTRVLAPVRISVVSALGTMLLRAEQFETGPALTSGRL